MRLYFMFFMLFTGGILFYGCNENSVKVNSKTNHKQKKGADSKPLSLKKIKPTKGAPGTTFTIYGYGFNSNPAKNTVLFNNQKKVVIFGASDTTLKVVVPVKISDGNKSISVKVDDNKASGLTFNVKGKPLKLLYGGIVPEDNDYTSALSEFSYSRMVSSKDVAVLWSGYFGANPSKAHESDLYINPQEIVSQVQRFYDYYMNNLGFVVDPKKSYSRLYKVLVYIGSVKQYDGGAAYGYFYNGLPIIQITGNRIGALSSYINEPYYGTLAHELTHVFQEYTLKEGHGFSGVFGPYYELTAQWVLWTQYPKWPLIENWHFDNMVKRTESFFLEPRLEYNDAYVDEWWATLHGQDIIGKIWRKSPGKSQPEVGPIQVYKQITNIDQKTFNDQMFQGVCHFITLDYPRVDNKLKSLRNPDFPPSLQPVSTHGKFSGWYQVSKKKAPANYGFNAVRLKVPVAGTKLTLHFKGLAGASGYRAVKVNLAGWRYGFLAYKKDGSRKYSQIYRSTYANPNGIATFIVPEGTKYLWLVVMGAPTKHFVHPIDDNKSNNEQWPYAIKVDGTLLKAHYIK